MKISYSFGMVDLLHYGHIHALQRAAEGADLSVFGLVSDAAADAWFGAHVSDETERRAVLESIKYVDRVIPQRTFDPIDNLRMLHEQYPDAVITLFHGDDFGVMPARRYLETIGGQVVLFDYYDKLSPQRILDTLNRDETPGRQVNNLISTKANTLLSLQQLITRGRIEDILVTTVGEFRRDPKVVAANIAGMFAGSRVVIRSSSRGEDAFEESNAGHFKSVIGTKAGQPEQIRAAVEEVIASYGPDPDVEEQVLIQRQTEQVRVSGVIFTRDIQRNRPYYVINFDETGSTDAVTSGEGSTSVWMIHSIAMEHVPTKWKGLIAAVREIEEILTGMLLDIEFAITEESVVIFQVRPLAAAYKFGRRGGGREIEEARGQTIEGYNRLKERRRISCYSDMAFWNPAEMIGDNPKNLDYSLYRQIITRGAWNEGIVPLGYRHVDRELMYRFGNKPYISLEYSFEALVPAAVSRPLAEKLCAFGLERLRKDWSAHDKIEFEIAVNCFDFSMEKRLAGMAETFSEKERSELSQALRQLTRQVIADYDGILTADEQDLRELERIRLDVHNLTRGNTDFRFLSRTIRTLTEAVCRFGTPQFSRQARCAFIARSLARSLEEEGYVDADTARAFAASIHTVAEEYEQDHRALTAGRLSVETFLSKYGHLRAGTYNIRSPRYDRMGLLFTGEKEKVGEPADDVSARDSRSDRMEEPALDRKMTDALSRAMEDASFDGVKAGEMLRFLRRATQEREHFKFVFTRSLSDVLECIKALGEIAGIEVKDLSYLELPEIYAAEYYTDIDRLREFWRLIIDRRRELYRINSELILPSVIGSERDFDYIENPVSRPNFITEKRVTAPVCVLEDDQMGEALSGRIVCIEKADPGYDWIFSEGIAGLVTKYGGAASHMAIRCAEFEIPAAIGCGAALFAMAHRAKTLTLDCKHERLMEAILKDRDSSAQSRTGSLELRSGAEEAR
ncbi:MAG: adenylyltransferase/cytidyltransferase family protein [Lachnospiraceae bacterium]|nr:adenylyltransferase/cytidyltransferase family protein [Lachnospiraceae bacterium]